MEIWLRTNRRALLFGMLLPAVVAAAGLVLVLGLPGRVPPMWLRGVGAGILALSLATILALAWQLTRPRLAYRPGELLVWLGGVPIGVPIEVVECFLLGQAPSLLPGKRSMHTNATTLMIRIADAASDWHQRDVKPQLGQWCGGYITIRGTWCEPLGVPLVNRLNQRLAEVAGQRQRAAGPSGA
jgi:hypothetical protein